jgi:Flp pilus assembly secretin CpaC
MSKRFHAPALLGALLLIPPVIGIGFAAAPPARAETRQLEVLHLSPSSAEVVELPDAAGTVVVGNPVYLTAALDNPKLLILIPGQPGATTLTVLDRNGRPLYLRQVVVSAHAPGHVTVTRDCANAPGSYCQPVSMLNCTEGHCVEIAGTNTAGGGSNSTVSGSSGGAAAEGAAGMAGDGETQSDSQEIPQ